MGSFGVEQLKSILQAADFDTDTDGRFVIELPRVVLYGCSATTTTRNLIVNKSEKQRIDANAGRSKHPDKTIWLMRLDCIGTDKGLHDSNTPDSVWLFPTTVPVQHRLLAPTRSKKVSGGASLTIQGLSPSQVWQVVLDHTPQSQQDVCADVLPKTDGAPTEVQRLVWMRTDAGRVFREGVRQAYGGACAFCDIAYPALLEAAHILPWSRSSDRQRISVRNGVLLCRNCHALLDANLLQLSKNYTIRCAIRHDHAVDTWRHNQQMRLPSSAEDYPDNELIQQRHQ